jgi:hypothetical protein
MRDLIVGRSASFPSDESERYKEDSFLVLVVGTLLTCSIRCGAFIVGDL